MDIFNNLSLDVPAGKTVALVGESGSGKHLSSPLSSEQFGFRGAHSRYYMAALRYEHFERHVLT